jgi:hypothetical protein
MELVDQLRAGKTSEGEMADAMTEGYDRGRLLALKGDDVVYTDAEKMWQHIGALTYILLTDQEDSPEAEALRQRIVERLGKLRYEPQ